jgi:hypothetical protein
VSIGRSFRVIASKYSIPTIDHSSFIIKNGKSGLKCCFYHAAEADCRKDIYCSVRLDFNDASYVGAPKHYYEAESGKRRRAEEL